MDAINLLPNLEAQQTLRRSKKHKHHVHSSVTSKETDNIIRHGPPHFNRAKILAKIKQQQVGQERKVAKGDIPDSPLLKNNDNNREKLKKMLKTPGAMIFSQKEREVLSKILNKQH